MASWQVKMKIFINSEKAIKDLDSDNRRILSRKPTPGSKVSRTMVSDQLDKRRSTLPLFELQNKTVLDLVLKQRAVSCIWNSQSKYRVIETSKCQTRKKILQNSPRNIRVTGLKISSFLLTTWPKFKFSLKGRDGSQS